jgi:hypothetical protein
VRRISAIAKTKSDSRKYKLMPSHPNAIVQHSDVVCDFVRMEKMDVNPVERDKKEVFEDFLRKKQL